MGSWTKDTRLRREPIQLHWHSFVLNTSQISNLLVSQNYRIIFLVSYVQNPGFTRLVLNVLCVFQLIFLVGMLALKCVFQKIWDLQVHETIRLCDISIQLWSLLQSMEGFWWPLFRPFSSWDSLISLPYLSILEWSQSSLNTQLFDFISTDIQEGSIERNERYVQDMVNSWPCDFWVW